MNATVAVTVVVMPPCPQVNSHSGWMCVFEAWATVPSCWLNLISRLHHAKKSFSMRIESDVTNSRYLLSRSSSDTSVQLFTITTGRPSYRLSSVLDRTTGKDPRRRTSQVRYVSKPCPHGHATNLYSIASRAQLSQDIFLPVKWLSLQNLRLCHCEYWVHDSCVYAFMRLCVYAFMRLCVYAFMRRAWCAFYAHTPYSMYHNVCVYAFMGLWGGYFSQPAIYVCIASSFPWYRFTCEFVKFVFVSVQHGSSSVMCHKCMRTSMWTHTYMHACIHTYMHACITVHTNTRTYNVTHVH